MCRTPSCTCSPTRSKARRRSCGTRKRRSEPLPAVVPELERHAEVAIAQQAHHFLELVLRRRGDAKLVALNGRLYFPQFGLLDELDDIARLFHRNTLLQRDFLTHCAVGGRYDRSAREVPRRNVAPDQAYFHDLPE